MLKRFAFRVKMLYLCTSEEEKARKHGAFSSFFANTTVILQGKYENLSPL